MLIFIKQNKLFSVNGAPRSGGLGRPRSGPVVLVIMLQKYLRELIRSK